MQAQKRFMQSRTRTHLRCSHHRFRPRDDDDYVQQFLSDFFCVDRVDILKNVKHTPV